jgi:hypothetical protein
MLWKVAVATPLATAGVDGGTVHAPVPPVGPTAIVCVAGAEVPDAFVDVSDAE